MSTSNPALAGFVRIINRSDRPGTVHIHAIDDSGQRFGPVSLSLDAKETMHLNSRDLEQGSASRGLTRGIGRGEGHWRLELDTALDILALAYIRTRDGYVTSAHDVVESAAMRHHVVFFNPGSNRSQRSHLRITNPGDAAAEVIIEGLDDRGADAPGGEVRLSLPPRASRMLSAEALEAGGVGFDGRLGDGSGKWQLFITSERPIEVMSLLTNPTGNLTNLSSIGRIPTVIRGPSVSNVMIESLPQSGDDIDSAGDTYGAGERITIAVTFDEPVWIRGTPRLALTIGTRTRPAAYVDWWCDSDDDDLAGMCRTLYFNYVVTASDRDTDGIGVAANALTLNGGTIRNSDGANASLNLGDRSIAADPDHKVNGGVNHHRPTVYLVVLNSTPRQRNGDVYQPDDIIEIDVYFHEPVRVDGAPRLALTIGTRTREAVYEGCFYSLIFDVGENVTCQGLRFSYVVQTSDRDTDGLSIDADALTLNGGAIRDVVGADADLDLGSHAITDDPGHKVDGTIDLAPAVIEVDMVFDPQRGDTYGVGEIFNIDVNFDEPIVLTGTPQLALKIGAQTRQAVFGWRNPESLIFLYTVQPSDRDADGISIAADALTVRGGTIRDRNGNDADLSLGAHAIDDDPGYKVDGRIDHVPIVNEVSLYGWQQQGADWEPYQGPIYGAGTRIEIQIWFDELVTGPATPQLALTIGTQTRQADYTYCQNGGNPAYPDGTCFALSFFYTVQSSDLDTDGIGIAMDALTLIDGAIRDLSGNDANLDLGTLVFDRYPNYKIDGRLSPPPM